MRTRKARAYTNRKRHPENPFEGKGHARPYAYFTRDAVTDEDVRVITPAADRRKTDEVVAAHNVLEDYWLDIRLVTNRGAAFEGVLWTGRVVGRTAADRIPRFAPEVEAWADPPMRRVGGAETNAGPGA